MNVYEQLQNMIENDNNQDILQQILVELKEIKELMAKKDLRDSRTKKYNKKPRHYYDFVNKLRKDLKADIENNNFPEISYYNRRLGINFKGLIYDKDTTYELHAKEAFEVYEYLYKNRDNLINLIKK